MRLNNQFGLAGQSDLDYDFFIGRGKRKKAKARRAMRKLLKSGVQPPMVVKRIIRPVAPPAVQPQEQVAASPSPAQAMPQTNPEGIAAPTDISQLGATAQTSEVLDSEVQGEAESDTEDSFLGFGKKAREKRQLRKAEKAAGIERMKAETSAIQSVNAPTQNTGSTGSPSNASAVAEQVPAGENKPEKSKSNMTLILAIVGGVVVVGIGLLILTKKPVPVPVAS